MQIDGCVKDGLADSSLTMLEIEKVKVAHLDPDFMESPVHEGAPPYYCYHKLTFIKNFSLYSHINIDYWWGRIPRG